MIIKICKQVAANFIPHLRSFQVLIFYIYIKQVLILFLRIAMLSMLLIWMVIQKRIRKYWTRKVWWLFWSPYFYSHGVMGLYKPNCDLLKKKMSYYKLQLHYSTNKLKPLPIPLASMTYQLHHNPLCQVKHIARTFTTYEGAA